MNLQLLPSPLHELYDPFYPIINTTPTQVSHPQSSCPKESHPFMLEIMVTPLPSHFKLLTHIDLYDGMTDLQDHLESF